MVFMDNLEEIRNAINGNKSFLERKFDVKSISLFGSYLRGDEREGSDIDILVEFSRTIDLFEFVELEDYLSDLLGSRVDLVMKDALKPRIKDRILEEAVVI